MKAYLTILFSFLLMLTVNASHIAGAEIFYTQDSVNPYKFYATVNVFQNFNPNINSSIINIDWGDGTIDSVFVFDTVYIELDKYSVSYQSNHTYLSLPANNALGYTISASIANRQDAVVNIDNGNSAGLQIYVDAFVSAFQMKNLSGNKSPRIVSLPDITAFNNVSHYDTLLIETDHEFSVTLDTPLQYESIGVPLYEFPDMVTPGLGVIFDIDTINHILKWDSPKYMGIYAVAIKLNQYLNDSIVGYTKRDYTIVVQFGSGLYIPSHTEEIAQILSMSNELIVSVRDFANIQFLLTKVTGQELLKEGLHHEQTSFSCNHLATGLYLYSLIKNGMILQHGKVMFTNH